MRLLRASSKEMQKIYQRHFVSKRRIEEKVQKIINDVRLYGDDAVIKYTRKFDGVKLTAKQLKVTESQISGAYQNIKPEFVSTLKTVIENVNKFYKKVDKRPWRIKGEDGLSLGKRYEPIERVGIYVPSGTTPLVSTVYMTVLPAQLAGVKDIVMVTPPNEEGYVDPHILVVSDLLKVDNIYKIGGAQAIAALAFGTKTIAPVDKIVGPGNQYVTEAKRQVFGYVDIDMLAGPTEVVIIANQYADLNYIMADLEAQAEHIKGLSILITPSKKIAKSLKDNPCKGFIILVKNLTEAAEIANKIAPEHLELMVKQPQKLLKIIKHAGAIFIGPHSPTALGDYIAGPSHVLPTGGTARFFSGLGPEDFIKSTHIVHYSKKALEKVKDQINMIAGLEGLKKHAESVKVRFS